MHPPRRPTPPSTRFRLRLAALEDRLAPATFTVNAVSDTGAGSGAAGDLRYCITQANATAGADAVVFDPALFATAQVITLASALPTIAEDLTITGTSAANVTVSGNNAMPIFAITGGTHSLSQLTLSNGKSSAGGALSLSAGTTTLRQSILSGNEAGNGGAIYANGSASLNLVESTLSGNVTTGFGGSIYFIGSGTLNVTASTIRNGTATARAGGIVAAGIVNITQSLLDGNTGTGGGALQINSAASVVTITNSTISNNVGTAVSTNGGAIRLFRGSLTLNNSTVARNRVTGAGSDSGGIFVAADTTFVATSSIIAGNTDTAGTNPDIGGAAFTANHSLIGVADGLTITGANNLTGTIATPLDPLFDPAGVAQNGGPTGTLALLPGSPAIGAGLTAGAPADDQRGFARTGAIDIGAFETGPFVVNTTADDTASPSPFGKLSLREALQLANAHPGADIITFDPAVFATPQTIALSGTELGFTDTSAGGTTTVTGPAAGVTVSGNGASRVFRVASGASGDITGLTVTGGSSADGGAALNAGTLSLASCLILGNFASGGGGLSNSGTLTLANCTISGNSATSGGGGVLNSGTLTLVNSTLSGNTTAGTGGGLANLAGGGATLTNTIVAGNTTGVTPSDIQNGGTLSGSNNLIGTGGSGGLTTGAGGNLVGVANPGLSALGDFGGPVRTFALLPGSPAIGGGTASGVPTLDARGKGRVGGTDIGAFESQGFALAVVSGDGQSAEVGAPFAAALVVSVTANDPVEPVEGGTIAFTPPPSGAGATLAGSPAAISGGQASVTATANGTAGGFSVAASANGATPVTFNLSNTLRAQTITFGPLSPVTYGASAFTLAASASSGLPVVYTIVSGPATLSGDTLTVTGAGTVVIAADQPGDATFAAAATVTQSLTVNRATLMLTADDASRVYGASNPTLAVTPVGFVNGDTLASLAGLTLTTAATPASGVGSFAITPAGATSANYDITFVDGTLAVTPAALTITANDAAGVAGEPLPAFTARFDGLVNGDAPSVVSGLTLSTATDGRTAGSFAITAAGATAANYAITLVPGTLTVAPAPVPPVPPVPPEVPPVVPPVVPPTVPPIVPPGVPPVVPPAPVRLYAAGAGTGGGPRVAVYNAGGTLRFDFLAFEASFRGGVRVWCADVSGDGIDDIVVGAGPGGAARVRVLDGRDLSVLADYFAYDDSLRGGVNVTAADFAGDGRAEVVTGAGEGGGPDVRVWAVAGGRAANVGGFFAFDASLRDGVGVTAADLGTGVPQIVATAPGDAAVRIFSAAGAAQGGFDVGDGVTAAVVGEPAQSRIVVSGPGVPQRAFTPQGRPAQTAFPVGASARRFEGGGVVTATGGVVRRLDAAGAVLGESAPFGEFLGVFVG